MLPMAVIVRQGAVRGMSVKAIMTTVVGAAGLVWKHSQLAQQHPLLKQMVRTYSVLSSDVIVLLP